MSLATYYNNIVKPDFLTKFNIKNSINISHLDSVVLSIIFTKSDVQIFSTKEILKGLLILELITEQKACVYNITTKVKKKKKLIGFNCKITLRKKKLYNFLNMLLVLKKKKILSKFTNKDLSFNKNGNCFMVLKDISNLTNIPLSLFFRWKTPLKIYFIASKGSFMTRKDIKNKILLNLLTLI